MKVVYARNCDIYYDRKRSATVLAKNGQNFLITNTEKEYRVMKDIIKSCKEPCVAEELADTWAESERTDRLRYFKVLWDKHILVEDVREKYPLEEGFLSFIMSNYGDYERLLAYFDSHTIYVSGQDMLYQWLQETGLLCRRFQDMADKEKDALYIGSFSEEECKGLLDAGNIVLLCEERGSTVYILYLKSYDLKSLQKFRNFVWEEPSVCSQRGYILPINIMLLFANCYLNHKNSNFLCIAGDATVHSFHIAEMVYEEAKYFNRTKMPNVPMMQAVAEVEKLAETAPFILKWTNKENSTKNQCPVCSYEAAFAGELSDIQAVSYHENYAEAGLHAFISGLEKALNQKAGANWRCGRTLNDYYAKGYISLLPKSEKSYSRVAVLPIELRIRLEYLMLTAGKKLSVYYAGSVIEGIGSVAVCEEDGSILYESDITYEGETELLRGIFRLIALMQESGTDRGQQGSRTGVLQQGKKLSAVSGEGTVLAELSAEEALERLKVYYFARGQRIDEYIWPCQVQIKETGVHVGRFYFVD